MSITKVTVSPIPVHLHRMAADADRDGQAVTIDSKLLRDVADMWHADREKIRYLESLIVKMARHDR